MEAGGTYAANVGESASVGDQGVEGVPNNLPNARLIFSATLLYSLPGRRGNFRGELLH